MSETIVRLTPALADRYRIEREVGAGGMARVFAARDLRHDRDVAIKVLYAELAAVLGAERFLAEIKTTAKLQHPHILPLLDSGVADGLLYYVMPLVDGESLRQRLERETQLPLPDALRITRQVGEALDYAHRHGIVHRDIKPENVLLQDGNALIADFGIALAVTGAGGDRLTATGLSLGTPQYMSPEQAMGERKIDGRSDIYSLGCVLYEMLSGQPPFSGPTTQSIIAQVITAEPIPVSTHRAAVPHAFDDALSRALHKLPADRYQSAAELVADLEAPAAGTLARVGARGRRHSTLAAWQRVGSAAGLVLAGALAGMFGYRAKFVDGRQALPIRLAAPVERRGPGLGGVAVSSDGRLTIVVGGLNSTVMQRRADSLAFVSIPGTEGAQDPFISPDDKWVAFTARGRLRKVPLDGGPVTEIADATWGSGTWGGDGTIVYTPTSSSGLWRTTAEGTKAEPITKPDTARQEFGHWWPQFLPDGRTVLFTNYRSSSAASNIEAIDLRTKRRTIVMRGAISGMYVSAGYLLFSRGTGATLFAVRFDADRLAVTGDPKPVLEDVDGNPEAGKLDAAVSRNGTLVYMPRSSWNPKRAMLWIDRHGRESPAIPEADYYSTPALAPDGRTIALTKTAEGIDIWIYDATRSLSVPITRGSGAAYDPIWTPDGRSLVYLSERGAFELYRRPADLSAPEAPVVVNHVDKWPSSVSPDGRLLAYTEWDEDRNIKFAALDSTVRAPTFPNTRQNEERLVFSPDGRWVAYVSDESGKPEVYVRPFPDMKLRRVQISVNGGDEPRWTRGGHEIVFRSGDAMVAAPFDAGTGAPGPAATLFTLAPPGDAFLSTYDVAGDGSRFLITKPLYPAATSDVVIVVNWFTELARRLSP